MPQPRERPSRRFGRAPASTRHRLEHTLEPHGDRVCARPRRSILRARASWTRAMEQMKAVLSRRTAAAPDETMPPWMALRQTHAPRRRGRPDGSPFWPVQEDVRGHAARLDAPIDLGFFAKLRIGGARHACATSASAGRPEGSETKCFTITSRMKVCIGRARARLSIQLWTCVQL